jgi:hypothetical protein
MTFPCQGQWWLPGSQNKSVFGTLTFTRRDGALLSLADSLSVGSDDLETDIIVGQTAGGGYVTLLHAIRTTAPLFRLTPAFPCSYHAPLVITGTAFDSLADMRFSLWQLRFPELKTWTGKHGFVVEPSGLSAGRDCPAVRIAYCTPPKQVLLSGAGGADLSLGFWPLLTTHPDVTTIRQDVYLEIRQADRDTLEDYMQTATRFKHFLTLATGSLVRTASIKAIVRTHDTGTSNGPILADILYQPIHNAPRRKRPGTEKALFTLPDITGREEDCFKNWFTKADWLDPVCALYFGTLYNPSTYLDLNFLTLVQAVEAYHRRTSDETDMPTDEHAARVNSILDAAPSGHRDWLREKLRYSNELSLRRRLKLLFAQFSYLLDDLIPDGKAMVSEICDNRNYLTHYDATLKKRAATGGRLLLLVEVLKLLLQACFLRELGLPDAKTKEFVSRSRSVRMIRHLTNRIGKDGC